jgi:hypothetical protein
MLQHTQLPLQAQLHSMYYQVFACIMHEASSFRFGQPVAVQLAGVVTLHCRSLPHVATGAVPVVPGLHTP